MGALVQIGEGKKRRLLILNKADFLSYELREQWARYFTSKGLEFVFFSAKLITEALEQEIAEEKQRELEEAEQEALAALQKEISSLSTVPQENPEGSDLPSVEDNEAQNADNAFAALAEDDEDEDEDEEEEEDDDDDDESKQNQPQKEEGSKEAAPVNDAGTDSEKQQEQASAEAVRDAAAQSQEQGNNDGSQEVDPTISTGSVALTEVEEPLTAEEAEKRAFEARIRESTKILSRQEMLDMLEAFQDDLAGQEPAGSSTEQGKQITVGPCTSERALAKTLAFVAAMSSAAHLLTHCELCFRYDWVPQCRKILLHQCAARYHSDDSHQEASCSCCPARTNEALPNA